MNILVVDDEHGLLECLPEIIDGHTWYVAESLVAAIDLISVVKLDVVIIDSLRGDGVKLAKVCKQLNIKTLGFTGGNGLDDDENFDAIAYKPDFEKLELILSQWGKKCA